MAATKHERILLAVRRKLESGEFRPGQRMPTDLEFVKEFKASRPTVAKALQDLEREGLIDRRPGAGTFVRARATKQRRFGLLIPGLGVTEIFSPICAAIARAAASQGHSVVWGAEAGSPAGEPKDRPEDRGKLALELARRLITDQVGGVFFAPLELADDKDQVNAQIATLFRDAGVPVVLVDRDYTIYPERSEFDLVGVDNRRIGYMLARHMLDQGAEHPVFISRPNSAPTIEARFAGFCEALVLAGQSVCQTLHQTWGGGNPEGLAAILKASSADALVCGNDSTAAEVLHALDSLGKACPEEMLVAGVDDVRFSRLFRVPLTTVRQPCAAIGQVALRLMLDRIGDPELPVRDVLLLAELVPRASTNRR
ncbi:MAG: hypothetical protein RLZZ440_430 [Planctomycetota bacterium]